MLANVLQKAGSHKSALETRETIGGEEGVRERHAIYSMHIPRTQSPICSHGVRSSYACAPVIVGLWNA